MQKKYVVFHLHDDYSNCNGYADSCTSYKEYIDLAKKQNMDAIAFSNHGGIYDWILKKQYCDKVGIKYIHGVELYLCTKLENDERGYHIGLYSKNIAGVKELNELMSISTSKGVSKDKTDRHFYYNPRISMKELMNTSDNIIITTACLASILWQRRNDTKLINTFLEWMAENKHRCFLEIQYHNHPDQKKFNQMLYKWSKEYNIPLIAGTDTHSLNDYKAECRKILQKSKDSFYGDEDSFDLTWKTYDELIKMFQTQGVLPNDVIIEAINNTNKFATIIDDFDLDYSFKYPNLYGDNAKELWWKTITTKTNAKFNNGVIDTKLKDIYTSRIQEEFTAMTKQGMESFMLFMSELLDYCNENNIPYGFCRGSVGGSTIAYLTDITDVDPVVWNTVFSRYCNETRISLPDIDIDFAPEDRKSVYEYIINRFTPKQTAYIAQFGTLKDRGTIDVLAKGLGYENLDLVMNIKNKFEKIYHDYSKIIQAEVNIEELKEETGIESTIDFDNHNIYISRIRNKQAIKVTNKLIKEFETLKSNNMDLFYYFDGIKGTIISKGNHPAGIVGSPITLPDNLGVFYKDGDTNMPVSQCAMKAVDSVNYIKFDILGLTTIGVIKDTYKFINSHYLKSHEINWNDNKVWNDMIKSRVGVFQFEGDYAHSLLKEFVPNRINDMSLVNAALRPSGKSYRDRLIKREFNSNPSEEIDKLLSPNNGFLVYQEDTIKFLTDICDFTGSEADTVRRAIGKKEVDVINEYLPKIIQGYCQHSNKPREVAEKEVMQFLQIIDDSSEYQFGYNHSTGYSMNGYVSTMLRAYNPLEFITAYLNRAETENDIKMGVEYAKSKNITINPIKFGYSGADYKFDKKTNSIYKGIASIKHLSRQVGDELDILGKNNYHTIFNLMTDILDKTSVDSRQLNILIKLDLFSEFGKSQKLLDFIPYFNAIYKAKVINKNKFEELNHIISKHSRETEKQYRDIDNYKILEKIWDSIPNKEISIAEKLKAQTDYLGYIDYANPKIDKKYILVTKLDTKYSPKFIGYCLNNGKTQELKVYKQKRGRGIPGVKTYFKNNPFKDGDLLYTKKFRDSLKSRKTDSGFEKIPNTQEWWLIDYKVVNDDVVNCIINNS